MGNNKFIKDISASTVQIGINQVASLVIFYLISKYISKEDFGFYNWGLAICSTLITVLSFGMDLVYVKRIASGFKRKITIGLHFFHTLYSGLVLIAVTGLILYLFPGLMEFRYLFLLILINQFSFSVSNSIKLCINGHEHFNYLAYIAILTNVLKVAMIAILFFSQHFTIYTVLYAFILSYVIEFLIGYLFASKIVDEAIRPRLDIKEYKSLIVESLPQLGTVLFDSALSRIDWILMGVMATSVKTAEYSFAFKIFEVSKMPYIILAPILLTRFSKLFRQENEINAETSGKLDQFFKLEMFISILIPLVAVCIWSPFFDWITDNKYGAVNETTYRILAVCIPLHYVTNFLWTMAFTQGQLKKILVITIVTSSLNIILNLVLIPLFASEGAALSFLISTILQVIIYYKVTAQTKYRFKITIPLIIVINGSIAALAGLYVDAHMVIKVLIALVIYVTLSFFTGILNLKSIKSVIKP